MSSKKQIHARNTGADCPLCADWRGADDAIYCGNCGKQLKETPVITHYRFLEKPNLLAKK